MQLPMGPGPWNFYRLGPAKEKELLKRRHETYRGVVIPAHIASYYHKFCAELIGSLRKPYFIDPMTYVFARDPQLIRRFVKDSEGRTVRERTGEKKKGDVKRSYRKLIEVEYKGVIKLAAEKERPLSVSDLDDESRDELVRNVVAFQREKLSSVPEKYKKYEKYAKKAGRSISFESNPPALIVAPYFRAESTKSPSWHSVNLDLATRTKRECDDALVFGVVYSTIEGIAEHGKKMVEDWAKVGVDGFLVWIDGFDGVNKELAVLKIAKDFVMKLSQSGPVISLYGDAFALVLGYFGLTGYTCGICYGERKEGDIDVDVEGPIPPRYYVELLKRKLQLRTEAKRIPIAGIEGLECECEICGRRPDPADLTDDEAREHFMLVRMKEIKEIQEGLDVGTFAERLKNTYERYREDVLLRPVEHLLKWHKVATEGSAGK